MGLVRIALAPWPCLFTCPERLLIPLPTLLLATRGQAACSNLSSELPTHSRCTESLSKAEGLPFGFHTGLHQPHYNHDLSIKGNSASDPLCLRSGSRWAALGSVRRCAPNSQTKWGGLGTRMPSGPEASL